jgi:hypothetical protein
MIFYVLFNTRTLDFLIKYIFLGTKPTTKTIMVLKSFEASTTPQVYWLGDPPKAI